jgi:hypothetical protein
MGPCHHGMARAQIAYRGTASNIVGSCEYIEYVVTDSRQGVILPAWGLGKVLTTPYRKNWSRHKTDIRASDLG